MKEVEDISKTLGLDKIDLHVFEHNERAINLYEKSEFKSYRI